MAGAVLISVRSTKETKKLELAFSTNARAPHPVEQDSFKLHQRPVAVGEVEVVAAKYLDGVIAHISPLKRPAFHLMLQRQHAEAP